VSPSDGDWHVALSARGRLIQRTIARSDHVVFRVHEGDQCHPLRPRCPQMGQNCPNALIFGLSHSAATCVDLQAGHQREPEAVGGFTTISHSAKFLNVINWGISGKLGSPSIRRQTLFG
jgi:hypothetical protein